MADIHSQRLLILDFGSQYTQLIARRVREMGVYCELHPYDMPEKAIDDFAPKGIILSGGPETVTASDTPRVSAIVFKLGCPVLGICYGMQAIAAQLGGAVETSNQREFGYAQLEIHGHSMLLEDIKDKVSPQGVALLDVWMSHGDKVTKVPQGFVSIASTKNSPFAAIANEERQFYGVQFHPEVTHTPQGKRILEQFVRGICGCDCRWTITNIVEESIYNIRKLVGKDKVLLALSGGVDSSVLAAILHKAISDQLICVFVDTGLLRLNEPDHVMQMFEKNLGVNVFRTNAQRRFLSALRGIIDPEKKRKIIGHEFINVFKEEISKLKTVKWLAQGTIYPDVIESVSTAAGKVRTIKSHHNVGGLPEKMSLKLIEPLKELFKDEVRKIGIELGLPYEMIYRHPFPGPGLAVRILGEIKQEYIDMLQQADAIFIDELRKANFYHKVSQAFAVFLPIKSVGVMGDMRKYDYVIALRAVETVDFMTAHWAQLPHDLLANVSNRIINEVRGISRVVYDISGKPPATIEWE